MIHIKKLGTDSDFQNAYFGLGEGGFKVKPGEPWLSYTEAEDEVAYNKSKLSPLNIPLTFRALQDDSDIEFHFEGPDDERYREIAYSINGGTWTYIGLGDSGYNTESYQFPSLNTGDTISFVGDNYSYAETTNSGDWIWGLKTTAGQFEVYGNIMSMVDSNNFYYDYDLRQAGFEFYYFFAYSTALVDASNLVLPSSIVYSYSYYSMFRGCTSLIYPPKILPARSTDYCCYSYMFSGCINLIKTPELNAINSSGYCYKSMFEGCTSLIEVPDSLLLTTVQSYSCSCMFKGCTSLVKAPKLPASSINSNCYEQMFRGCTNLLSAPTYLPALTLSQSCYYQMFYGCSRLDRGPELPAKTLTSNCYYQMFYDCLTLHYVKCNAYTNIATNSSTYMWLYNTGDEGILDTEYPDRWVRGNTNGIPNDWFFQTIMWIDDFPEDLPDYDGCDDWYDWYDLCYTPECGDGFIYTEETIDYNGETFFLWKNLNYDYIEEQFYESGGGGETSLAFALTRTANFNTLDSMAIEHDFINRHANGAYCPVYAFLNPEHEDDEIYMPRCNDATFVLSCVRR